MQLANDTRPQVRRDRIIRLEDVMQLTGLKKSTVYLMMRRNEFPRCVRLGSTGRRVGWAESHVLQWVQDRISEIAPHGT